MGRRHESIALVSGHNPKQCPEHGEPTDVKTDHPTYCLDCDRAVRATGHPCWRHVKPIPQSQVEAKQKAEDEEAEKRKTFAERMHSDRKQRAKAKDIEAELTLTEKLDLKQRELAIKAIRKAKKLRKRLGLSRKPR
jgi:hypothetical protein